MTDYDLNAVADALASVWEGLSMYQVGGVAATLTAYSEAPGQANVPAVVIELDDLTYDASMGRGADTAVFLAYLFVSDADSPTGQQLTRQVLSSGGVAGSMKDALEQDSTLGGLVSYALMTGTRTIGTINYNGIGYQGATLEIQVMLQ